MRDLAHLRLDDGKANAIDTAFLDRLRAAIDDARDCKALVLSGRPRFFSAGFSLPQLVTLDRDAVRAYLAHFDEVMLALYAAPFPVVAAINGHALAGGCVLALAADRRVMADRDATIGLNEVRIGIGLPLGILEQVRALVPSHVVAVAMEGRSFDGAAAKAIGLVDEVCAPDDVDRIALEHANRLGEAPRAGYAQIKAALRRPVIEAIARGNEAEMERWLDTWFSDEARAIIGALVDKLTKKAG